MCANDHSTDRGKKKKRKLRLTGRRGGGLGSSKAYTPGSTTDDLGGVMAFNSTTNRDFHTWTMVFVHYCDGSSFSSHRRERMPLPKSWGRAE